MKRWKRKGFEVPCLLTARLDKKVTWETNWVFSLDEFLFFFCNYTRQSDNVTATIQTQASHYIHWINGRGKGKHDLSWGHSLWQVGQKRKVVESTSAPTGRERNRAGETESSSQGNDDIKSKRKEKQYNEPIFVPFYLRNGHRKIELGQEMWHEKNLYYGWTKVDTLQKH